jgi:two-component system, chemotaxis family, protein-glutamate methylesterase/glutaminase
MHAVIDRGFPAIVIGGSAGAIEALMKVVSDLPADFPGAVFVVTHVPATSISALPHLLSRAGALFATHAIDGAPIAPGRIIVAPPDHHLTLQNGVMRVLQGPTENNHRPSIDVLFRSAAIAFGPSACGVLLSGTLDDGSAGMVAIREAGGGAFVQDPDDAQFADMPLNALRTGAVEGAYPAHELVGAVQEWMQRPTPAMAQKVTPRDERVAGVPSVFTCPDCGGTLWELDDEAVLRFRCRTGHAYSGKSMLSAHERHLESALWAAIRTLQERRDLLQRMMARCKANGDVVTLRRLERQSADVDSNLTLVNSAMSGLLDAVANPA